MKRLALTAMFVLLTGSSALADDSTPVDARLQGYRNEVTLQAGSTTVAWLEFVGLGVVCLGVLFINSRRTHLD